MPSFPLGDIPRPRRATYRDALKVRCPECSAAIGAACTYLPPIGAQHETDSDTVTERLALIGTPMNQPHNERFSKAFVRLLRLWQQKVSDIDLRPIYRTDDDNDRALIAHLQQRFDREERRQLVAWLARWAFVLTECDTCD